MIKPDCLVTWPIHLDFPLFRYNMVKYKDYFRSLTIVLSNHHMERDYSNFIRKELSFATFVEGQGDDPDWRNGAVNRGLDVMPKDGHVLFMEQDFFWKEGFLDKVLQNGNKFVFFAEGLRFHPAFALVERKTVDKTPRDFSAYPDTYNKDHFGKFFDDLLDVVYAAINIDEFGVTNKEDYYHMNGLSQEYMNYKNDQPFYNKDNFLTYNNECRYLPIENHPEFYQIELAIRMKFGKGDEKSFLKNFFPPDEHPE